MKIGLACDHGGYELKEVLKKFLQGMDYQVIDYGTDSEESVDYPDYGEKLSKGILENQVNLGIAICGTGVGISIACNKVKGIRAGHCTDSFTARAIREHNNCQIMCLGGRITGEEIAKDMVVNFLNADFQTGRHQKRIDKMMSLEEC